MIFHLTDSIFSQFENSHYICTNFYQLSSDIKMKILMKLIQVRIRPYRVQRGVVNVSFD